MGKTRKGLQAAGLGFAAASILFFGQAGAAHAPIAFSASSVTAAGAASAAQAPEAAANPANAQPLKNLKIKVPSAGLVLSPAVDQGSYPRLALGPISYPDGALKLPGRIEPVVSEREAPEVLEVGHSVSAPTAIQRPDAIGSRRRDGSHAGATYAFAGLPFISPAHAADPSVGDALGGPLTRMPIQGHVLFGRSDDILTKAAQAQLDGLIEALRDSHAALEVVAYGGERESKSGEARRLALRRGLAVRSYLISRGVGQARISVRPMGGVRDGGPQARVDVFYASY